MHLAHRNWYSLFGILVNQGLGVQAVNFYPLIIHNSIALRCGYAYWLDTTKKDRAPNLHFHLIKTEKVPFYIYLFRCQSVWCSNWFIITRMPRINSVYSSAKMMCTAIWEKTTINKNLCLNIFHLPVALLCECQHF